MNKRRYILFSILSILACHLVMASGQNKMINVTDMGARPDDGKDDTRALRRAVAYACEHPGTTLYFPKGIYELKDKEAIALETKVLNGEMGENPEKVIYTPYYPYVKGLDFTGAKQVTVWANQATLLCEGWMEPISLDQCEDVTVKGITIDYKRKPFVSGDIVEITSDYFDVQFGEDKIVTEKMPLTRMMFWDKEKNRLYPEPIYFPKRELLGGNKVRFYHSLPQTLKGSNATALNSFHFRPAILVYRSVSTCLEDVTIHAQPGMGIVGFDSKDIFIKRLSIRPSSGYYQSTNTDATHFACCEGVLHFQGCYFQGQGDDAVGIDAQQQGHLAVLGRGAHGLAHLGVADEERQGDHGQHAANEDEEVAGPHDVVDVVQEFHVRQQAREGQILGSLGQQHIILQEDGHADGGNERREARRAAQGLVGDLFQREAVGGAPDDGGQRGHHEDAARREAHDAQHPGHQQGREGAEHVDLAMREVDELDDAVHQRIAQGNERVDAAAGKAAEEKFNEILDVHAVLVCCGSPGAQRAKGRGGHASAPVRRCRLVQGDGVVGLHELAALDHIDGQAETGGVAALVEGELAQRGIHFVALEGFEQLGGVGAAAGLDGLEDGLHGGIGIVEAEAGFGAELLHMGFTGLLVHLEGAGVLGIGGQHAFAVLAGHLEEGLILHAVGAHEGRVHAVAAHLLHELGGRGLIAAEDEHVGLGAAQLAHHGGKVHGVGGHGFKEHGLDAGLFKDVAVLGGEALAVFAVVVQVGDFLGLDHVLDVAAGQFGLGVVMRHGAQEVGVLAFQRQRGRGGRGGDADELGAFEHGQRGIGGAGADGAHDRGHAVGDQLGGGVGRQFGLALVILGHEFDLLAQDAALGVGFLNDELGGIEAGHAVGGKVAGMRALHADLDGVFRQRRGRERRGQQGRGEPGNAFFHRASPHEKKLHTTTPRAKPRGAALK